MTKNTKIADRYAKALFTVLRKRDKPRYDSARVVLRGLSSAISSSYKFRRFVSNLFIPLRLRKLALKNVLSSLSSVNLDFPDDLFRFIEVVFDNGRIAELSNIAERFSVLVDVCNKVVKVKVTSAFSLSDSDRVVLQQAMTKYVLGRLEYEYVVSPDLLGGLVIKMGGKLLDASLRTRLYVMHKEIEGMIV